MVNFYVYRIKNGLKKWTDVPPLWNEKVKEELVTQGYVLNEDGTVTIQKNKCCWIKFQGRDFLSLPYFLRLLKNKKSYKYTQ